MRINDSIAYHPDEEDEEDLLNMPVATIGVLDIFGFESFTTNSFEQLCINYCNEALQQQFNAFVLKNEQAEYEREGIEWSFIEFPENQDVLDLIDKRGSGILNILDDQCRAPGTTDRSFASDVYSKCTGHSRFRANRKQVAVFQFEVHHYAGFVEYTTDGFVEKNRDEMHNESTVLLANSTNPFVCFLSEVLSGEALPPSNDSASDINTPYKLRRSESSAMKATVGGQFRRQLRELRFKIDKTAPHYVRCLKPNDHLVADDFDPVIVAEQLRCGGILEAVRVSRAGFQHYPHAEFCKRYRCVATKDMKKTPAALENGASSRPTWAAPAPHKMAATTRWGVPWLIPTPSHATSSQNTAQPDAVNYKEMCKELLKVIYRKVQAFEAEENKENGLVDTSDVSSKKHEPPAAKAKSYSGYSSSPPTWSKTSSSQSLSSPDTSNCPPSSTAGSVKSRYQPWTKPEPSTQTPPTPPTKAYNGNFRRGAVDFTKVGIQLGKTKVFLRHSAFETLERLRSRELTSAATKLNAIFRMYLCRLAYVPVRDAFRAEMRNRGVFAKETKEDFTSSTLRGGRPGPVNTDSSSASRLIAVFESEVRASIHNPITRNHASIEAPTKFFKWVLLEGIWVKNPMISNGPEGIAQ
ncbi:myosin-kinesin ATPase superfamily-like protein [Fragilaria crotonensis]|nr:myosin-kinesin ATPase superfamily-like protein [Fragilaria crotonensis]